MCFLVVEQEKKSPNHNNKTLLGIVLVNNKEGKKKSIKLKDDSFQSHLSLFICWLGLRMKEQDRVSHSFHISLWQFFKHTEQFQFPSETKERPTQVKWNPFSHSLHTNSQICHLSVTTKTQCVKILEHWPKPLEDNENPYICLFFFFFWIQRKTKGLFSHFTSHFFNCRGLSFITCCWTLALDIILWACCGLIVVTLNFKRNPSLVTLFCIFDLVVVCQTKSQQKNQMVSQQTNKKNKNHNTDNCQRVFVLTQDFFVLVWGFVLFLSVTKQQQGQIHSPSGMESTRHLRWNRRCVDHTKQLLQICISSPQKKKKSKNLKNLEKSTKTKNRWLAQKQKPKKTNKNNKKRNSNKKTKKKKQKRKENVFGQQNHSKSIFFLELQQTSNHFFSCCDLSFTKQQPICPFVHENDCFLCWRHPLWSIPIPDNCCNFCLCFEFSSTFEWMDAENLLQDLQIIFSKQLNGNHTSHQGFCCENHFLFPGCPLRCCGWVVCCVPRFFFSCFWCDWTNKHSCQFGFRKVSASCLALMSDRFGTRKIRLWLQQSWKFEKTWLCIRWWKRIKFLFTYFDDCCSPPQGVMITQNGCLWYYYQTNNKINKKHKQPKISEWYNAVKHKTGFFEIDKLKCEFSEQ